MNNNELMSEVFGFSAPTYFRWKKEKRPIIELIEKYFSKKDLEEFLEKGKVLKYEKSDNYNTKIDTINDILIDNAIYQLRDKLRISTESTFLTWLTNIGAKKILHKVLKELSDNNKVESISTAKEFLIEQIKMTDVIIIAKGNKKQLIDFINNNFSNLECYVLINNYDKVTNYDNYFGF